MEEVYVALNGSAEFDINGQHVSLDPEQMRWVGASAQRRLGPVQKACG